MSGYHVTKKQAEDYCSIRTETPLQVKEYRNRHDEGEDDKAGRIYGVWNIRNQNWEFVS